MRWEGEREGRRKEKGRRIVGVGGNVSYAEFFRSDAWPHYRAFG